MGITPELWETVKSFFQVALERPPAERISFLEQNCPDLDIRREALSTETLTELIWAAAARLGHQRHFLPTAMPVEDDHAPFLRAGVPSTLLIDFDYPPWHTADDTLDKVSPRSLQTVGEVLLDALPDIERWLLASPLRRP